MLATIAELKLHLHTAGAVSGPAAISDELLGDLLEAASSRMAEERPERTLEPDPPLVPVPDTDPVELEDTADPVERRFAARSVVQVPDLREVTSVSFDDGTPLDASQYRLIRRRPDHPALWLKLATGAVGLELGRDELIIVGRWGPADSSTLEPKGSVHHAALVWAARAFHNRTARYGDTVATPDGGVTAYFRQLPPDVLATVNALQIPGA